MPAKPLTTEQQQDAARLKAIYEARKGALRLTQDSLAAACGWDSQGTISQYLNGKIPLNIDALLKIASNLQCAVSDISPSLATLLSSAGYNHRSAQRYTTSTDAVTALSPHGVREPQAHTELQAIVDTLTTTGQLMVLEYAKLVAAKHGAKKNAKPDVAA